MTLNLTLAILAFGVIAALGVLIIWISDEAPEGASVQPTPLYPILSAGNQEATHASKGACIPMPKHLKTRDEMVQWMTKELPKLTGAVPDEKS